MINSTTDLQNGSGFSMKELLLANAYAVVLGENAINRRDLPNATETVRSSQTIKEFWESKVKPQINPELYVRLPKIASNYRDARREKDQKGTDPTPSIEITLSPSSAPTSASGTGCFLL